MIAGRVTQASHYVEGMSQKAPLGVASELKRLHFDIADAADRSPLSALTNLVPVSQILFGSDFPFVDIDTTASGMTSFGFSKQELQATARENALALFPRLKR